jgi:hypothetical protein
MVVQNIVIMTGIIIVLLISIRTNEKEADIYSTNNNNDKKYLLKAREKLQKEKNRLELGISNITHPN